LDIPKEKLVELYKKMYLIRNFECTVLELYSRGKIFGALHSYIGQEAVAVGVCASLRKEDYIVSTHRGHGHCLAKGMDVSRAMAELFGKNTGVCGGKGGSMHVADPSIGVLGASGIVGGGIPLAVGAGLSAKYRKTDQVAVSFFSDGASNQGTFHESVNLAAIWDLPVIFVCENNLYAESTPVWESTRAKNIADRAVGYGIPGAVVDGMDVIAVYEEAMKAVGRARQGKGPTLIECKTYRFEGHEVGEDWHTYRTDKEVEEWKSRCPITRFRNTLINRNVITKNEIEKIEQEVKRQLDEAIRFAEQSPEPDAETALHDVFVSQYI